MAEDLYISWEKVRSAQHFR